ncbi:hypothetical protein VP01_894g8 [Puccinia sorghi]|uniref:Uncharacterized protein n=1 Tax=Puccinia sorghi TaxID=27349 RepID=A0A0L6U823_9BASI|nr:hypothetical protein VP01_894g8 [Puccinia sorghi]
MLSRQFFKSYQKNSHLSGISCKETTFKANWATCKPGWHNPKTKHKAEDFIQAKSKPKKSGQAAKAAVDQSSNAENLISLANGNFLASSSESHVYIKDKTDWQAIQTSRL